MLEGLLLLLEREEVAAMGLEVILSTAEEVSISVEATAAKVGSPGEPVPSGM